MLYNTLPSSVHKIKLIWKHGLIFSWLQFFKCFAQGLFFFTDSARNCLESQIFRSYNYHTQIHDLQTWSGFHFGLNKFLLIIIIAKNTTHTFFQFFLEILQGRKYWSKKQILPWQITEKLQEAMRRISMLKLHSPSPSCSPGFLYLCILRTCSEILRSLSGSIYL